jgi:cytidylate kinase
LEDTMNVSTNLGRYAEALERSQRHWRTRHTAAAASTEPATRAITIALTREAGTPGTSVAQDVGKRLGWPVYDHELVEIIARELGLRTTLLESVDEKRQSWLNEAFQRYASVPSVSENSYVRHLTETILSLGSHGQCVIVGRGAAQILPVDRTLRVRLVAPREDRITAAARRRGITAQEATRWVDDTDRERVRYIRDHFLKDPSDIHQYDLLLNASRWSVGECAELIGQALQTLDSRTGI